MNVGRWRPAATRSRKCRDEVRTARMGRGTVSFASSANTALNAGRRHRPSTGKSRPDEKPRHASDAEGEAGGKAIRGLLWARPCRMIRDARSALIDFGLGAPRSSPGTYEPASGKTRCSNCSAGDMRESEPSSSLACRSKLPETAAADLIAHVCVDKDQVLPALHYRYHRPLCNNSPGSTNARSTEIGMTNHQRDPDLEGRGINVACLASAIRAGSACLFRNQAPNDFCTINQRAMF